METGNKVEPKNATNEFFDLRYASEPASYYYLILVLQPSSVKACWYHSSKNLVTGFAQYELNPNQYIKSLKELLKSTSFLTLDFKQVLVMNSSQQFGLFPMLVKDYDHKELLSMTHRFGEDNLVLNHSLINVKAKALYGIDPAISELIEKTWSSQIILPAQLPLIEEGFNRVKHSQNKDLVLIHIQDEHMDIIAFKAGKLELANSFYHGSKEDVAYYLLYTSELMDLDPEKTPLKLCGNIDMADQTWKLLAKYWKHMDGLNKLQHIQKSESIQGASPMKFDYLTHALLCAS